MTTLLAVGVIVVLVSGLVCAIYVLTHTLSSLSGIRDHYPRRAERTGLDVDISVSN